MSCDGTCGALVQDVFSESNLLLASSATAPAADVTLLS